MKFGSLMCNYANVIEWLTKVSIAFSLFRSLDDDHIYQMVNGLALNALRWKLVKYI